MGEWSELPQELLMKIAGLTDIIGYIRLRAVSISWRSMLMAKPNNLSSQLPWLMLPSEEDPETGFGRFLSLFDGKIHKFELPEFRGKQCCGTCHGWMCMVSESPSITLLNPITRQQIEIPSPLGKLDFRKIISIDLMKKVILSSSPSIDGDDFTALTLQDYGLAFFKPGSKSWTYIYDDCGYDDIIYFNGKFYASSNSGSVYVVELLLPSPRLTKFGQKDGCVSARKYLVESCGELFMVCRRLNCGLVVVDDEGRKRRFYRTNEFLVYNLDDSDWVRVEDLGGRSLFVGYNCSFSVSGCKPNCIYFTDCFPFFIGSEHKYGGHDIGIYHLEDHTIEHLPGYQHNPPYIWPPPIWFMPVI